MKREYRWASVLAAAMLAYSAGALSASNYQDWWWNPAQSGMGFNIGHQGDTVVVSWYHFDDGGDGTYMLLSGKLKDGVLDGNLERTTGPAPGPGYASAAVRRSVPGTARIAFTAENSATFTYDYDGKSGSIPLQRYSYATPAITGDWRYAHASMTTGCIFGANNGYDDESGDTRVTSLGGSRYTITFYADSGGICTYTLDLPQAGSIFTGSGTFSCASGIKGNITVNTLRIVDGILTAQYQTKVTTGETCSTTGKLGAVR